MIVPLTEPLAMMLWENGSLLHVYTIMAAIVSFICAGSALGGTLYFFFVNGDKMVDLKDKLKIDMDHVTHIIVAASLLLIACVMTGVTPLWLKVINFFPSRKNQIMIVMCVWFVTFGIILSFSAGLAAFVHGQDGTSYNDALRANIKSGIQGLDDIAMRSKGHDAAVVVRDLINFNQDYQCCALEEWKNGDPKFFDDPTRCDYQKTDPCSELIGDFATYQGYFIGVFGIIMGITPLVLLAMGICVYLMNYVSCAGCQGRPTPPGMGFITDTDDHVNHAAYEDFDTPSESTSLSSSNQLSVFPEDTPNTSRGSAKSQAYGSTELENSLDRMY